MALYGKKQDEPFEYPTDGPETDVEVKSMHKLHKRMQAFFLRPDRPISESTLITGQVG
jgi:hypothetical protein